MLILTRRAGEKIIIQTDNGEIAVSIKAVDGRKQVRVGIAAPRSVLIVREELMQGDPS